VNNFVWQRRTLELDPHVCNKWKNSVDVHSDYSDKRKDTLWMQLFYFCGY